MPKIPDGVLRRRRLKKALADVLRFVGYFNSDVEPSEESLVHLAAIYVTRETFQFPPRDPKYPESDIPF